MIKKIFFIVLIGCAILTSVAWSGKLPNIIRTYYDSKERNNFINRTDLINKIKSGEVASISELTSIKDGFMCVLFPYSSKVYRVRGDEVERINSYLQKEGVSLDEGEWGMVVLADGQINMSFYPLSKKYEGIHIVEPLELNKMDHKELPVNFEPSQCSYVDHAAFYKTHDGKIIFGRVL